MATEKESYVRQIMREGEEYIKQSHPDARDFRYIGTKDLIEGKLTQISFDYDSTSGVNYLYDRAGRIDYFRTEKQLIDTLGAIQPKLGVFATLLRADHVTGLLALVVLAAIIMLVYFERSVPEILENALALILGFYFGRQRSDS
jgi:hypothetical protein